MNRKVAAVVLLFVVSLTLYACGNRQIDSKSTEHSFSSVSESEKPSSSSTIAEEQTVSSSFSEIDESKREEIIASIIEEIPEDFDYVAGVEEADGDMEDVINPSTNSVSESSPSIPESIGFIDESGNVKSLSLEEFDALSGYEQDLFIDSFVNSKAFFEWYHEAQRQYKIDHPNAQIGPDGNIIISD